MNEAKHYTGVVTKELLRQRLAEGKVVVSPLLSEEQIGNGSIDIRLGTQFITSDRPQITELDPRKWEQSIIRRFQHRLTFGFNEKFVLHPGSFVLGSTFEFIALPENMGGFVLTRSRYGRAGLLIATATYVHPCWKGCLTLELENLGEVPIALWPGTRIGQLVLLHASPEITVPKLKSVAIGPTFATLEEDPRWDRFQEPRAQ